MRLEGLSSWNSTQTASSSRMTSRKYSAQPSGKRVSKAYSKILVAANDTKSPILRTTPKLTNTSKTDKASLPRLHGATKREGSKAPGSRSSPPVQPFSLTSSASMNNSGYTMAQPGKELTMASPTHPQESCGSHRGLLRRDLKKNRSTGQAVKDNLYSPYEDRIRTAILPNQTHRRTHRNHSQGTNHLGGRHITRRRFHPCQHGRQD